MVITSGRVAIVDGYRTDDERIIIEHGAGRFLGELTCSPACGSTWRATPVRRFC